MESIKKMLAVFNLKKGCEVYQVSLWKCPQFLFILMGGIIISAIITTYLIAQHYARPEIVIFIVSGVTIILFIISYTILSSFEKLAAISQEKSEFIRILSHQLRNPLSSIKWQLNTLLYQKNINEHILYETLSDLEEKNEEMIKMINNLLELDRLEEKDVKFNPSPFSLLSLIKEIIRESKEKTIAFGTEIEFLAPKENIIVFGDRNQIKKALNQILDNAIYYNKKGEKIDIIIEKLKGKARIMIRDKGIGIPSEETKQIFKKFFRGKLSKRYKTEGLGLGLYLANLIIRKSKGKIKFSSVEGGGTTFWVELPLKNLSTN